MPNFFVIGAMKAGTTSLYNYLDQHPDVYMSPTKEPQYFEFADGAKWEPGPGYANDTPPITDPEPYRALFEGVRGETAIGEASTAYLSDPGTAGRIKRYLPDARLIAVLRHPVERAYSQFLHGARGGIEPLRDFSRALAAEEPRTKAGWGPWVHYRRKSLYYSDVKRYLDTFGPDKFRVYLYEDLAEKPTEMLRDVFRFLGVDDAFVPDHSVRYNEAPAVTNRLLRPVVGQDHLLARALKRPIPPGVRRRLRGLATTRPPEISPETRAALAPGFREDVLMLQGLIGRDLSGWLG